jgi:hypothetical protein
LECKTEETKYFKKQPSKRGRGRNHFNGGGVKGSKVFSRCN